MTRLESRFLVTRTRLESRWKHCWLDSSHVSHRMTRIESESFFYKISEPLMGKSSSVARGNHVDLVWFLKYSFLGTRITWLCLSVLTDASVSSSCWIFFKDIMFLKRYGRILSWVFAEGQNCFLPHLDIGTKNHTMLENLKSASRFRLNSCKNTLFTGMALTLHKSQLRCSGVMRWWVCRTSLMSTPSPADSRCKTCERIFLLFLLVAEQ